MKLTQGEQIREYEAFVTSHRNGHLFQTQAWSEVKGRWISEYVLVRDGDGRLTGAACARIRRLAGSPYTILYVSRGPVCDWHDGETFAQLTQGILALARQYRAIFVRMDPAVPIGDAGFRQLAQAQGYRIHNDYSNFEGIQARFVWRIPLRDRTEEQLLASFTAKHRYNVRLAARRGVQVRAGSREEIALFYSLLQETARRDGFTIRNLAYFYRLYDRVCGQHGCLLLAWLDGQCIAGAIISECAGLGMYLYGATSNAHRQDMPAYLIQWEAIRYLLGRGAHTYDLRGVPGDPQPDNPIYGLYRFKKGFGGSMVELIGELEIVQHPLLYRLFRFSLRARKRLAHLLLGRERPVPEGKGAAGSLANSEA